MEDADSTDIEKPDSGKKSELTSIRKQMVAVAGTPLSQFPAGTFFLRVDMKYPDRDRKPIVSSSKIQNGFRMVLESEFFPYNYSNGDKIIGKFASGAETLGFFPAQETIFWPIFLEGWGPLGL